MTPPAGAPASYGYDQADRLTSWNTGSTSASYVYNGDGLRISKTVGSTSTEVWDESGSLPALIVDGATDYVYGPDDLPLEQVFGSTTLWLHQDRLGSTRLATDPTGTVQASWTYTPYGAILSQTGNTGTRLLFTGQYQDVESGFYYLRARYYDPVSGLFLTRDPAVATTLSPYGYANGDPLNRNDLTGLCSWNPFDSNSCELAQVGRALTGAWNATTAWIGHNAQAIEFAISAVAAGVCVVATLGVCAAVTVVALSARIGLRFASGSANAGAASLLDALLTAGGLGLVAVPAKLGEAALEGLPMQELNPLYRLLLQSRNALPDLFSLYADAATLCPRVAPTA